MNCPICKASNAYIVMVTRTTWGQGDSTYVTTIECTNCGHISKKIYGWGLFPNNQEWREALEEFL